MRPEYDETIKERHKRFDTCFPYIKSRGHMITHGYKTFDEEQLRKIDKDCFPVPDQVGEKDFADRLHCSEVWLVRDDSPTLNSPILGFAFVDPGGDSASLIRLAVRFEHRGQGIGGALTRAVLKNYKARNYRNVRLHVRIDNPAQKLYFDHGFRVYEIAYKYYADDANALMMKCTFGG
jgi:ribosomal protein S18 acetylase RimI-like enzyme